MADRLDALPYYKWHWQRWRANRRVQRLTLAEKGAYRELLDECWAEGFIPDDMPSLADICGCSEAEMAEVWPAIKDRFYEVGTGCLTNKTLEEQRTAIDNLRAANARNGKAGAEAKIANAKEVEATAKRPPSDRQENSGDRHIEEKRREEKSERKEKTSRAKKPREVTTKTDQARSRHAEFKAAVGEYWAAKNIDVEMPWGPAEGRNLEMWLRESPQTTVEQFKGFLRNRFRSPINHAQRPSRWIGNITSYANGPCDQFGNPLNGGNNGNGISKTSATISRAHEAIRNGLEPIDYTGRSAQGLLGGAGGGDSPGTYPIGGDRLFGGSGGPNSGADDPGICASAGDMPLLPIAR